MSHELSYRIAELERRLANLCFVTEISSTDPAQKQFRVRIGADESAPLPWPADIRKHSVSWKPLKAGQQVLVACPGGDPAQAAVVQFLYSDAIDAPSTDDGIELMQFADGSTLTYRAGASELSFAGTLTLKAATSITLETPIVTTTGKLTAQGLFSYMSGMSGEQGSGSATRITGPIIHDGELKNSGTLSSNGITLDSHVHDGVQPGNASTGGPK